MAQDGNVNVVMLHNRYRSSRPSGENLTTRREVEVLRQAGLTVRLVETSSDDLVGADRSFVERARVAPRAIWNRRAMQRIRRELEQREPDVVHLQNDFPQLGPAIHQLLDRVGVPYVQSIHNYRFACVDASFFRDGQECHDCLGRQLALPGVWHRCGGSAWRSLYVAGWMAANARTRTTAAPLLLANSRYVATQLVAHGIPHDHVRWRHNVTAAPCREVRPLDQRDGVVVAGRLDAAKGIGLLARTWAAAPPPGHTLTIFGDGPERDTIRDTAAACPSITHAGIVDRSDVLDRIGTARLVVVPSQWPEPFGLVAVEALERGTPALVTDAGGLPEIIGGVTPELIVPAGDMDALRRGIHRALTSDGLPRPEELAEYARAHFGVDTFVDQTRQVYRSVMQRGSQPRATGR